MAMTQIQQMLDHILMNDYLASVTDLIHYHDFRENSVIILRKQGCNNVVVDVSKDMTPEDAVNHVRRHPAFY